MIQPYKDMLRQAETDLDAARAEIERLTAERNEAAMLLSLHMKRAEKAEAKRDEARAQVAAAYGSAADALQNVADNWDCGHNESRLCDCARDVEQWGFAADEARSMTPADAQAALEAYGREKVREGMKRAVDLYPQGIAAILDEMEKLK